MESPLTQNPIPEPTESVNQTPANTVKPDNRLVVILSVFLLIAVSIAGFFAYQNSKLIKLIMQSRSSPTPNSSPAPDKESSKIEVCYQKTKCEGPKGAELSCANPASVFCICMGGELEIRENDNGQYGVCKIEGKEYDEWEYFRMKY